MVDKLKIWQRKLIEIERHMVVGFTTSYAIGAYRHLPCELMVRCTRYNIIYYVRKFVGDLRQVCGFLWVFWFPQPIKLNTTI